MLVTVLYRLAGSPEVEGKVSEKFKDCKDGAYYEKAVLWAAANGIVAGYSDGTFKPSNPVNRQELAKILYGYDLFAKRVAFSVYVKKLAIITKSPFAKLNTPAAFQISVMPSAGSA